MPEQVPAGGLLDDELEDIGGGFDDELDDEVDDDELDEETLEALLASAAELDSTPAHPEAKKTRHTNNLIDHCTVLGVAQIPGAK